MKQEQMQSYLLHGPDGMSLELLNFGARVSKIHVPTPSGNKNVALGYDAIQDYMSDPYFLGATVGRYANRIANGQFELEGQSYVLPQNNGTNHLHGGPKGFSERYWQPVDQTPESLVFELCSEEGDQGYPGRLLVQAEYRIEAENKLVVEYRATTSKPTPVNLSSHTYFNLDGVNASGLAESSIHQHDIMLNASKYTPVNQQMIPTGEQALVSGSVFDLRQATKLASLVGSQDSQMLLAGGFDHNFIIDGDQADLRFFAQAYSPLSGIQMRLYSNQPGVQFYTGNFLDKPFQLQQAFCLETQNFPNAPNQPDFPSSILPPGETYLARTEYVFTHIE